MCSLCLSSGDPFIFSVKVSPFYFCVICTSALGLLVYFLSQFHRVGFRLEEQVQCPQAGGRVPEQEDTAGRACESQPGLSQDKRGF